MLERTRVAQWDTVVEFWGRFIGDCMLMFTATAYIVGFYNSVRTHDRSNSTRGLRRLLLWIAVFVAPFAAGLKPIKPTMFGSNICDP